ncbi:uncharacterized protein BX663DRAFT_501442 [Cokeromyces recurvatus]|uniref:uncharacterized protein n=1 Tax=Cokeromyces recurvatus TaxID=90255 RepID=UPI00221E8014|nr:uncharacterized protein BX663DRAFT_501442 [Cokeromyces recurvatus]KAI7905037.1 hypothetical protein BX663DRAFT_501442 [Cokeromyces recurvatus]
MIYIYVYVLIDSIICNIDATEKKAVVHPPRRTYLYNQYNEIVENNQAVFIFQHSNLAVKEFTQIRQQISQITNQAKFTVLRTGIFSAILRQTKYANLKPLIAGPTCVLSLNKVEDPSALKKLVETMSKNKKLLLLGGKLDDVLLTQEDILKIVDLPPLNQLRAQLVGTIEAPARKLLGTLEQPASELHSVLSRRIE